jgi:hypothetical protein
LNNLHQLSLAWLSYAQDSDDRLPNNQECYPADTFPTDPTAADCQPGQPHAIWVLGDVSNNGNAYPETSPNWITHGLLYPYAANTGCYKCPRDPKTGANGVPTIRSYSMNAWMGGHPPWSGDPGADMVNFTKLTQITGLSPAMALVFIEENSYTINDGFWVQDIRNATQWLDCPARYHISSCKMSFADGHSENRVWTDKNVLSNTNQPIFPADPTSKDLAWVHARCTCGAN